MRSRGQRDQLALGAAIALLGMAVVSAIVAAIVQIVRDPSPQHPGLFLFGVVGGMLSFLAYVGVLAVVVSIGMAIVAIASDRRRSGRLLSNELVGGVRR
jgi:uncharacterized BrkB/YihY/UPF0761 family membrane protein